jgi:hypothetical protein
MGCYSPPPLKESHPKIYKGGGHKKWCKMHWPRIKKDSITVGSRNTSRSPMPLFLLCMGDIVPCRIGLCFMTLLVLCFITRSSWFSDSSGCSERKKEFLSNSNVEDNIPYWGTNFQTGSIIDVIGDDILLDNRTTQTHEVTVETVLTWHRNEQRYLGY